MEPKNTLLVIPGPREHLKGTLALLEGVDVPPVVRAFLDRPQVLPATIELDDAGLKYDMYITASGEEMRWGLAIADRHEDTMLSAIHALADGLEGNYALDQVLAMRQNLTAEHAMCVAVGFDNPGMAPRLKLYFQEDSWDAGIGTFAQLQEFIPGLPDWVDANRSVGVMTVGMYPDGRMQPKIYLGAPTALEAAAGSPAMDLAEVMHRRCAHPGYYYLTIRPGPSGVRYAINKIYNTVQVGFINEGSSLKAAWQDVAELFAVADQLPQLHQLQQRWESRSDLRVVPTATAIEAGGTSVDVYCGAWDVGGML